MSANTIFVIITTILVIAVLIYLIAIKKGKEQQKSGELNAQGEENEDDEEL